MKISKNINTFLIIIILILINIFSYYYFTRFDLTTEKKYSFDKETEKLIEKIDDIIYFKIYLHGNIPIEYKQLAQEIKHLLNELRTYSNLIEYDFIDPSSLKNKDYKIALQQELFQKGISPIPHRNYKNNKLEETWVFPGITVSYKSKETTISLIEETLMNNPNKVIKNSIEKLEYLFTNAIRKLTSSKKVIGILNNNLLSEQENLFFSFQELISENYKLIEIPPINGKLNALQEIECLILNNPTSHFTEKDKFIIDQYIMSGKKSIWMISGTNASMDSLETKSQAIFLPIEKRNLSDLLFKYGVRINQNLIQDLQAAPIPIITHFIDDKPQWDFFPWTFFPILNSPMDHLITKNINPIKSIFPSSIDLINNSIKKTTLLETTNNTKITPTPALVNLEELKQKATERLFNDGNKNIAVLLEGMFESVFKNRVPQKIAKNKDIQFKEVSIQKNKMIIISDGHFINNQFTKGQPLPMGFDKHTGVQYGNGQFILNCIDYLLDNKPFIQIRSKDIKLRLLNSKKINTEKKYWQLLNLLLPLIFIIIISLTLLIIRKQKYRSTYD